MRVCPDCASAIGALRPHAHRYLFAAVSAPCEKCGLRTFGELHNAPPLAAAAEAEDLADRPPPKAA